MPSSRASRAYSWVRENAIQKLGAASHGATYSHVSLCALCVVHVGLGICALWLWCLSPTGWEYRERCRFFEPFLSRAIFLLANICLVRN